MPPLHLTLRPNKSRSCRYFNVLPAERLTTMVAVGLIARLEADPDRQERLQTWHRKKFRLHSDIFAPPQRSFREARWWQARISDDSLHGYSFHQPSLNQALVILEALDRHEPGWDKEPKSRRECRFMNELATLSPELCKPGCTYPHGLPEADALEEQTATAIAPPVLKFSRPSLPSGTVAQRVDATAYSAASPDWTPPVPARSPRSRKRGIGWRCPVCWSARWPWSRAATTSISTRQLQCWNVPPL